MNSLEDRIQAIGSQLLKAARSEELRLTKQHTFETALLDWCMKNQTLKVRTFQFIDLFPDLISPRSILKHLREYFPRSEDRLPKTLRAALALTRPELFTKTIVSTITRSLYIRMAKLFIGGSNEKTVLKLFDEFESQGIRLSIDLLGESTASESEAEEYFNRYQALILALGTKKLGIEKQNISIKLSSLDPFFDPLDAEGTSQRVRARLGKLVRLAQEQEVFVHIDMEEYMLRDLTLKIVREFLEEECFKTGLHMGIVLQAYLRDSEECLKDILSWAKNLTIPLTIRLVRGAYWDTEIMKAEENHWPIPVFTEKHETNACFERLTELILDNVPKVRLAIATHNIRSIAHAIALSEIKKTPKEFLEFQLLYGMGASLMKPLLELGFPPRMYTPIGDPIRGMAYLVRRLLENVSTESFVRQGIHVQGDPVELLRSPSVIASPERAKQSRSEIASSPSLLAMTNEYHPTSPLMFFDSKVRDSFRHVLETVKSPLEKNNPPQTAKTSREGVSSAISSAQRSFEQWSKTPLPVRVDHLKKAAAWLTIHRYELAALQIYEVGKTWKEADADVVEAIDYLNFYAATALEIARDRPTEKLAGEINSVTSRPRGVAAIIAPWNFPMAILTGMSAAALVTGNTIVVKPSQESPRCAWKIFQAFEAAGFPQGVINFLTGEGKEIGPILIQDPRIALIAFTGSKEVGTQILSEANLKNPNQKQIKKLIIEMGGKNAAIVDETADFDLTIPAVLHSAFSFAGQKCSALSRLIILDSIYDAFLNRLVKAAASFSVGNPLKPRTQCGPVINKAATERIKTYIEEGRKTGRILFEGNIDENLEGFYVAPTLIDNLPRDSRLLKEEIFGPVLSVIRVKTFQEALERANETDFALTGGVFSRTPSHIEVAKAKFDVGNLYINRTITGAVVGRQPFGGHKMSGTGTKAGGMNYLREFCIERTISENVSRHGFAPL